jgi:hypothetical protein
MDFLHSIKRMPVMIFKIRAKTIFINLLTTLILALILECVLGYWLRNPELIPGVLNEPYRAFYNAEDRNIIQVSECAEYDPQLFYRLKPGTCVFENRELNVVNHVNSAGLRDDEESLHNPAIVVLGDSFSMGWGVDQERSYPSLIEKATGKKVLNAAISSFGTAREVKLLKQLGIKQPHTVILQYHANDFEENKISEDHHYKLPIRTQQQYDSLRLSIDKKKPYFLFKYMYGISKAIALSLRPATNELPISDTTEAKLFLNILLNADINLENINILVYKIDNPENDNDAFVDAIDRLLTDEQYSRLKITTVRVNGIFDDNDVFILDDHMNANGHKKIAARLTEYLQRLPKPLLVAND